MENLRAEELRIGNWVMYSSLIQANEYKIVECELYPTRFAPIPLTEEWLIKFGFKLLRRDEFNDYTQIVYGKSIVVGHENSDEMLVIYLPFMNCEIGVYNPVADDYSYLLNIGIDHVHQLQNLFYSLTNTEL